MRTTRCIASAALLALATITLNGCGADDTPPASNASTTAPAANDAAQPPATAAAAILDASAPTIGNASSVGNNSANPALAASDPIAQNMQANLAADSQQIAPVMRYAPGDSANN
ncbi:hypothetical protein [Paraburkholderia antibiotica]|uniref:Lipoprotein n=1 Tax=Paraburkholderia antibiotica TaxID=2728839 RepID=A0A7Y0A1E0_9BURK|nr:hypothetical protein [Paraburkholderia antibiotica]NML34664.1 hypothetical protein [Paraburkholderia antibiotica]